MRNINHLNIALKKEFQHNVKQLDMTIIYVSGR
jgi:hypothetical protein